MFRRRLFLIVVAAATVVGGSTATPAAMAAPSGAPVTSTSAQTGRMSPSHLREMQSAAEGNILNPMPGSGRCIGTAGALVEGRYTEPELDRDPVARNGHDPHDPRRCNPTAASRAPRSIRWVTFAGILSQGGS
jgi:hypothetical protein